MHCIDSYVLVFYMYFQYHFPYTYLSIQLYFIDVSVQLARLIYGKSCIIPIFLWKKEDKYLKFHSSLNTLLVTYCSLIPKSEFVLVLLKIHIKEVLLCFHYFAMK